MDINEIMVQIKDNIKGKSIAQQYIATSYYERQIDKYKSYTSIVLFGASEVGRQLFAMLRKEGIQAVRAYCDNDRSRQGILMDGVYILSPDEAVEKYTDALFIVTAVLYSDEIIRQLISLGIQIEQISLFDIYRSGIGE